MHTYYTDPMAYTGYMRLPELFFKPVYFMYRMSKKSARYRNTVCSRVSRLVLLMVVAGLTACSTAPSKPLAVSALNQHFCDSYLMYQMCADDLNADGEADVLYFEDSGQVFMLNPNTPKELLQAHTMHECMQIMDSDMLAASSALHRVNDQMGALQRSKIKARLMLSYTRYMSRINECRSSLGEFAMPSGKDDFGDEDYGDL